MSAFDQRCAVVRPELAKSDNLWKPKNKSSLKPCPSADLRPLFNWQSPRKKTATQFEPLRT